MRSGAVAAPGPGRAQEERRRPRRRRWLRRGSAPGHGRIVGVGRTIRIESIALHYDLTAPAEHREAIERGLRLHPEGCPAHQSGQRRHQGRLGRDPPTRRECGRGARCSLGPGDEIADTGLVEVDPQPSPGSGRDRRGFGRLAVDESSPSRTVAVSDLPPPPGPPPALRGPLDVEIVPTLAPTSGSILDGDSGVGGAGPPLRWTRTADQILE